jgi:ATP-dependent HslUV protease, peptidase subunit HslV
VTIWKSRPRLDWIPLAVSFLQSGDAAAASIHPASAMSTLVIVRKGLRAVIASDSLFTKGSIKVSPQHRANARKIHRFKDVCIGFTGWSVFHNIFESVMERYPGDLDFRSRRQIFETFQKLHQRLKKDYFVETEEKDDQAVESSQWDCLIAAPAGIFEVNSDRGVYEYATFWADGSGTRLALGAMHALYDQCDDPALIARAGIEAACEFDDGSGLPAQVFEVKLAAVRKSGRRG